MLERIETFISKLLQCESGMPTYDLLTIGMLKNKSVEVTCTRWSRPDGVSNQRGRQDVRSVTATGKTYAEAMDILIELWEVYERRMPPGIKGLLPAKPRGKAKLRVV